MKKGDRYDYKKIKKRILKKLQHPDKKLDATIEFFECKQNEGEGVEEYSRRLKKLAKNSGKLDDKDVIKRMRGSIKKEIAVATSTIKTKSLKKFVKHCKSAEKYIEPKETDQIDAISQRYNKLSTSNNQKEGISTKSSGNTVTFAPSKTQQNIPYQTQNYNQNSAQNWVNTPIYSATKFTANHPSQTTNYAANTPTNFTSSQQRQTPKFTTNTNDRSKAPLACFVCKDPSHFKQDCPVWLERVQRLSETRCHKCQQVGHLEKFCQSN